jgi:Phage integrase family
MGQVLQALPSRCMSEWVFPNAAGSGPLDGRDFDHLVFRPALHRASIRDFGWKDLRHTFATCLRMQNVDLKSIGELMGHTTPRMTDTRTPYRATCSPPCSAFLAIRLAPPLTPAPGATRKYMSPTGFEPNSASGKQRAPIGSMRYCPKVVSVPEREIDQGDGRLAPAVQVLQAWRPRINPPCPSAGSRPDAGRAC